MQIFCKDELLYSNYLRNQESLNKYYVHDQHMPNYKTLISSLFILID